MRVLLTGGTGLVGRALRRTAPAGVAGVAVVAPDRAALDLLDRPAVMAAVAGFDAVIHAAAKVGGIAAHVADPAPFLADNLRMDEAVLSAVHAAGVARLIYLGSSCAYPRDAAQPMAEEALGTGPLEPTNEGYALAKLAGMRLTRELGRGRDWRVIVPCNLFGVDDHFDRPDAHLVPAAIARVLEARRTGAETVTIWGRGTARREFLEADHLARFLWDTLPRLGGLPEVLNVGAGEDFSVDAWFAMIAEAAGWRGRFVHDLTRPEGVARKLMASDRALAYGYRLPGDPRPALARAIAACEARHG